jgi:hypothetical protein
MKLNSIKKPCNTPEKKPGGSYADGCGCVAQLANNSAVDTAIKNASLRDLLRLNIVFILFSSFSLIRPNAQAHWEAWAVSRRSSAAPRYVLYISLSPFICSYKSIIDKRQDDCNTDRDKESLSHRAKYRFIFVYNAIPNSPVLKWKIVCEREDGAE